MWLHNDGGWRNPEISDYFASYVEVVVNALSDNVRYWLTVNEPAAFVGNGYVTGAHAPFENGLTKPLEEMYGDVINLSKNVLLAHGKAVRVIRTNAKAKPQIGMALNGNLLMPKSFEKVDIELARVETFPEEAFFSHINWWADPAIFGTVSPAMRMSLSEKDMETICQPLDFFGFNCYNASNYDEYTGANPAVYPGMPRTAMEWPITPDALYWAAKFLGERYGLPILITENGMANIDFVMSDGKVHDPQRIEYIQGYLNGLQKAADEGVQLIGYLYWSIMDNFEWAEGYDKRFGLIYVDYQTQKRTRKDSSYWYSQVIKANGLK
jgi:beta-glucosidase